MQKAFSSFLLPMSYNYWDYLCFLYIIIRSAFLVYVSLLKLFMNMEKETTKEL